MKTNPALSLCSPHFAKVGRAGLSAPALVRNGTSGALRPARPACTGFTLLELLAVMGIIAMLAALSVPVMNSFKPSITAAATRQMLDDLARARQLAISQRTTVYMVFVPPGFWSQLNPANLPAATNLLEKQATGYNFFSLRSIGDQPGNPTFRYLSTWKTLPEGMFIAREKFLFNSFGILTNPVPPQYLPVRGFDLTNAIPFPLETSFPNPKTFVLPYIAFNYQGSVAELHTDPLNPLPPGSQYEVIPLARGSVAISRDPVTKTPNGLSCSITETPPGNATNTTYNAILIDRVTGRAHAERMEVQ